MIEIKDYPFTKTVQKFGRIPDIDAADTNEDVWDGEGAYTFLGTATALKISSSDAKDTSAGVGVKTVTVEGLDTNYKEVSETVSTSGLTGVSIPTSLLRVHRAYGATVGTEGDNAGNIWVGTGTITDGVPANKYAGILASHGQTMMAIYTIPKISLNGNSVASAKLVRWYATVSAVTAAFATVGLQTRVESGCWRTRRVMGIGEGAYMSDELSFGLDLDPGTDIRLRVLSCGVNSSTIEGGFDIAISEVF